MGCCISGSTAGNHYVAREMMFGLREQFRYFECSSCGCVQIQNPPSDVGRYYPDNYYSFNRLTDSCENYPKGKLRRWAFGRRNEAQLLHQGGFWGLVARLRPRPDLRPLPDYFSRMP